MLALGLALSREDVHSVDAAKVRTERFALTILHTNDIHAHDAAFQDHGRMVGGLDRIASLVKKEKQAQDNVLAVDAGDFFQGTMLFQKYKGTAEVNLFNLIGYDVVTLGNHEFDEGPENLYEKLLLAKFPVISCNLDLTNAKNLAQIVKPHWVKEIHGQKIAFVGVITPELERIDLNLGGVRLKQKGASKWIRPVREQVEAVKAAGVNKVILVSHCGLESDERLARGLPDVDVIIGGHSHTRLDQPIWIAHNDGTVAAIVQTGSYGRSLGRFELVFDNAGRLIRPECRYQLINIDEQTPGEAQAHAYLAKMEAPLLTWGQQVDGYADGEFDNSFRLMSNDSALGDLICDALYEAGSKYGARISLQNRGGIRGRIEKGPISEEKVEEILPFDNKVVFATVDGATLLKNLERSVDGPLGGSFLEVHGLRLRYDPHLPRGRRLVSVEAQNDHEDWKPVTSGQNYKIVMNDYNFRGGEAYDFKAARAVVTTEDRISDALRKYLRNHQHIAPTTSGRITAVN